MRQVHRHLLRVFITGLLAALPLAATVLVFGWAFALLRSWVGPASPFGEWLGRIGLGVAESELLGYVLGIGLIGVGILLLGLLTELGLQRGLVDLLNAVMRRIPLVRSVYELAQRFVELMSRRDPEGTRAMQPVWCHFGGRDKPHSAVLGLQSSPETVLVDGRPCLVVLVPTAPVPVGGGLLFVPEDWVSPAELSAEAITSLYVSMGVTAPQYLPVVSRPR
ncbi:MAG: DUF502 domain-containing protein [Burkholderiales bacterium]|uniref:DUF502 domain-containing protein n=1 Tax=Inhella sp. TaxID=1921806 RepID=UPI001AD0E890|nr:DUF502 domain-containing protein [Burkholderiales bacterium]